MAEDIILNLNGVTKTFGDQVILDQFHLSVKRGEVIVIVGPSGCGKSTLLRCINGLESIQAGTIELDGETITKGNIQKVGMVFQSYELFPHMTVLDNVTLAPIQVKKRKKEEVEKEAKELLGRIGLEQKTKSYPKELSGGQKQRVAIARALCMHPEILLFDEVTAALDPEMVHEVLEVILDLANQGKTMLIVTHEMEFARAIADRILFLEEGKIIEESSPEEFFTNPKTERTKKFLQTFKYEKKERGE